MVIGLVLLTYSTSKDESIDEQGEVWPSEVLFQQGFCSEASHMFSGGKIMYRAYNGLLLVWGNIYLTFEV